MSKSHHRWEERELPWGKGRTAYGLEYLFNRLREPLWMRYPDGAIRKCDGDWLFPVDRELFYGDDDPPWLCEATLERCRAVLAEWGVPQ